MSIRQNGNVIAGLYGVNTPLLHPIWSDRILNDVSWLRADTYSWQSGDLYIAAYEHLLDDWNNGTLVTETVGNKTFSVKVAKDGHRMFSTNGHDLAQELYDTYGVSWYYIIDIENKRFKLPRTKFGFTGVRTSVGGYVAPGVPNITGVVSTIKQMNASYNLVEATGAFSSGGQGGGNTGACRTTDGTSTDYYAKVNFNASRSSSVYGQSDTVQPAGTQMYLYFFVGHYDQNQYKLDTGRITELVNDFDIVATSQTISDTKNEAIADVRAEKEAAEVAINDIKNQTITNVNHEMSNAITNVIAAGEQAVEDIGNAYPIIANYQNYITNCILSIPQNIKLELADGVLTLKAGSKVYVPNGSGNYAEITIENDLSRTVTSGFEGVLFYYPEENRLSSIDINYCSSGTVLPSAPIGTNHWVHYKTDDNRIYYTSDAGETWSRTYSLPLCVFTSEETDVPEKAIITRINQVFNGFGYIGSTVFALPGINYLIPNGRTPDGLLYNKNITTQQVQTHTAQYGPDQIFSLHEQNYISIDYAPTDKNTVHYVKTRGEMYSLSASASGWDLCYVEEDNLWYSTNDDGVWSVVYKIPVITTVTDENLNIISFEANTTLHHDDRSEVVHRYGNETISGKKTFIPSESDGRLVFRLNNITIGETPDVNHFGGFKCVDSKGKEFGNCNSSYNTNGRVGTNFYVSREIDGTTKSATLGVFIDADGTTYAQAPTVSNASDNSTNIATTAFIHKVFDAIYPVGSVYLGTQTTCPMTIAIPGSTWALVSSGKALWTGTGSNGNTTIEAGLPNITGAFTANGATAAASAKTGAFYNSGGGNNSSTGGGISGQTNGYGFDASLSNAIYGKSTTVQPPAYVVNVWRRTA